MSDTTPPSEPPGDGADPPIDSTEPAADSAEPPIEPAADSTNGAATNGTSNGAVTNGNGSDTGDGTGTDVSGGTTRDIEVADEMRQSFLDYAMSVITARALPDVRDGLKPVHRRILWSMFDTGLLPTRPHKKCATVVGDVIANYHPHGDMSIYDALVRMGQHFSLANPLVDPHGNFGSPNDPPAAYRYTECRLTTLAMSLIEGIDEETVDFSFNFDGSRSEPLVMPSRFPNLLVNGSQGIAVGMATNIPTHNLGEVIDATIHLINNPEATTVELMKFIPAPDFPTGGSIMGQAGALEAYQTGRGSIRIRSKVEIKEARKGTQLIVTEIPYQTAVEGIEEKIAELVKRKILGGIRGVRNESSKGKTRMVIDLKADANPSVVLNQLYKQTPLQSNFAVNLLALRDGVPRTLTLRDALVAYVEHQVDVVTRRSEHRLAVAKDRAHVVEGLLRALDLIDNIIKAIRSSEDRAAALAALCGEGLEFSERQANHILDMQLVRLTRLGRSNLEAEITQLQTSIAELEQILGDDKRLYEVIEAEMTQIRDKHRKPRRSEILPDDGNMELEDLIDNEPLVVTLSTGGYAKAMEIDEFRTQARGGKGVIGAKMQSDDVPVKVLTTTAHSYLLFFTNFGKVYRAKAYDVPKTSRTARGIAVVNLLKLQPGETVQAMIDADQFNPENHLTFVTRNGLVKRTKFSAYGNIRTNGLIALGLRDGDELVRVLETEPGQDLFITSSNGKTVRFSLAEVRSTGRGSTGVIGMRLKPGDAVVAADVADPQDERDLFLITNGGFGKRTPVSMFDRKHRGIQGVVGIKLREDRGNKVVGARMLGIEDELLLLSEKGTMLRLSAANISQQGRTASGVRTMSLAEGDSVAVIAPVDVDIDADADDAVDVAAEAADVVDAAAAVPTENPDDIPAAIGDAVSDVVSETGEAAPAQPEESA